MWWFGWMLAFGTPVWAAESEPEELSDSAKAAEYQRLTNDLARFAEREIWPAVERTYLRCLALYPDPPSSLTQWDASSEIRHRDHVFAAHAAQIRGDQTATRRRLVRAMRKDATREVVDWLWAIDTTYTEVELRAQPGTTFQALKRPFDPTQSRSIDIAVKAVEETGSFHGLVPRGPYRLGARAFEVRGGIGTIEVDLLEGRAQKKPRRKKPKKDKKSR